MDRPISKSTAYVGAAARFSYLVYVLAKDRGLLAQSVEHSRFIAFQRGKFAHMGDRNWSATAICVAKQPSERLIVVGEEGQVFTYVAGQHTEEKITPPPRVIRALGVVDGIAYACGMKRQVYRRDGEALWTDISAPCESEAQACGFEAIDGFNGREVYAVGWSGEIWQFDGETWTAIDPLTDFNLTGLCASDAGHMFACGQSGTLLRGRGRQWSRVDLGELSEDLWSVAWFQGRLYLSSMTDLYVMDDDALKKVSFGDDRPRSFHRLTHADGVLWSVGASDVFAFDGNTWSRVD